MTTYVIRRLIQFVFIMFGLSLIFFLIIHLVPGGPCEITESVGARGVAQKEAACVARFGLNKPLPTQYITWIFNYLHGNFGVSFQYGLPVSTLILDALPITCLLAISSYVCQQLIALPLGIFSALRQYSIFDLIATFISYVGLSMPTFVLGLFLLYFLTVQFRIFPSGGVVSEDSNPFLSPAWYRQLFSNPPGTIGDVAYHLVLPAFTLMFVGIAGDSRFMRASMLDVIHQDYIRTAKAKGLSRRAVIFKHALRNAILPIITNIALYLPTLVGGFVITESIWTYNGVGHLFITSLGDSDYQVVLALLMLSGIAVLVANLLADLTYAWVDPRIRYD